MPEQRRSQVSFRHSSGKFGSLEKIVEEEEDHEQQPDKSTPLIEVKEPKKLPLKSLENFKASSVPVGIKRNYSK